MTDMARGKSPTLSYTFKTSPVDLVKQAEAYRDAWRNQFPEIVKWWREQNEAHAKIMLQINDAFAAGAESVALMNGDEQIGTIKREGYSHIRLNDELVMHRCGGRVGFSEYAYRHGLRQDVTAKAQLTEVDDGKIDYSQLLPGIKTTEFNSLAALSKSIAEDLYMPWSLAALDEGNAAPSKPAQATTKIEIPVRRIASHAFGPDGTCDNLRADDGGPARRCGRRFGDIASATKDDLHKAGWSCNGTLAPHELAEIEAERERIWAALKGT
jgi:hypothetical protein